MNATDAQRWSPRVTVAAVIRDAAGRHLLVEEAPQGTPVLNQPAGHLEPGESLIDAVVREVREETSRLFVPRALLGVYRWQVRPEGDTYLRFCFLGDAEETLDTPRDPDILGTRWLSASELSGGRHALRSPLVMQCVRDAEDSQGHPLSLLHELGIGDG